MCFNLKGSKQYAYDCPLTHTYMRLSTHKHFHTLTNTRIHTHTRAHTRARAHTHTRTRTHTHAYTHNYTLKYNDTNTTSHSHSNIGYTSAHMRTFMRIRQDKGLSFSLYTLRLNITQKLYAVSLQSPIEQHFVSFHISLSHTSLK